MTRFRKKSVEIDAVRWWGKYNDPGEWPGWFREAMTDHRLIPHPLSGGLAVKTPEGTLHASIGDMIIRGHTGELATCRADLFEELYETA